MSREKYLAAPLSALILTGCVNLAPDYERPAAPVPMELPVSEPASAGVSTLAWQDIVQSEDLRTLIALSLEQNRDLRTVAATVEVARANLLTARSGFWPSFTASGSAQMGDSFQDDATYSSAFRDSSSAQIGVSAWELDFFGRVRNSNDAAMQTYLASVEGERATKISLVASVAEAWLQLAADQELLRLAEQTAGSQKESLDLTQALFDAGTASEIDLRRASASVASARAQAAEFRAIVRRDLNTLRYLVGTDLPPAIEARVQLSPSAVKLDLPVGQSSDVLLRRPDVIQAERNLLAANANIGAARAAYFPSVSLIGGAGVAGGDLTDLFEGDYASGWTFTPSISVPIFDFGTRRGNLDAARANADAALASYEGTIQQAFREVANALAVSETISSRLEALEQLADDTGVTLYLSQERFKSGLDDYLTVLDAQRENYNAQQELILANLDRGLNSLALYRSLAVWDASLEEAPGQ
ncbi:TolC family protein [uncultured Hyphomonas sp.]|jgi:NodT family efflux transporter outer membrane factor (OMF) lipoprotein|uniref:TolC family protein n=1 Tax=uncultured Hyphomonas sp. TaxID=225298 RepID=UPI000C57C0B7|nr:transporter [Hyphomonadaceae bacterium]|tara:strand:+ start:30493 stop:31911 length:1419 start_codon:yes stop_codon:yes gene_type:complete